MADSLLSFGVEKLWDLLVRESERFQGVKEQFNELKSDLNMLRCFLEDADAKKQTSAMVRNTLKEIKEIVYDAEDIIETFILKEEMGKTSGIRNNVRRFSSRRGLAVDMKAISKRIAKVIRDMQILGVQKVIVNERDMQSLQEKQRQMRKTFPTDNEDHLVGLEENVEKLIAYLVEEDSIQVVSVTGMGGIGKTTLARQVFNHEMVKNHFDGVAWVCVSQEFTRKYVWQTILQQLRSKYDEQRESSLTEEELQNKLFRLLETSSSLIVLDDMWREEDWDIIKPVFPSKKGWKILVTSRNENVASRADPMCVTFKPDCLSSDESWTLFRRIAFLRKETRAECEVDVELEDIGRQMINHCGGLPLAIKVLGGLLAAQHTLNEWKRIFEDIKSHIIGGTSFNGRNISSVYHILYLSFEELPVYLKQCFLYLAHFPEDYPINVENLAYYWAAEGIPRPRYYEGATIQEIAYGYIEELVKRHMVISERDATTSRFETCHMHDMMREVCVRKAEEDNFLHIVDSANYQSLCESRRIAVHKLDETSHPKWEMENPKLRSILFINGDWRKAWMESGLCFERLQLMKVLDLSQVKFEGGKLPSDIGKLIHLRYLNLYQAEVNHLPSSMRNLKLLIYLNLDVKWGSPIYMPNFLREMRELRELTLPFPWKMHDKTMLEMSNLVNLETLKNFSTKHSSVKDLQRMTKLRSLSIYIEGKGCNVETLSSSLSELRHLEVLDIDDFTKNDEKGFVLYCIHLKKLDLSIYMPRLPDGQHLPSHLTTISLEGCRLEKDPMPILEKLPQLKEVCLSVNSFSGRRIVCSGGGSPQLQRLKLEGLEELEEWIVEEGSMPLLCTLYIWDCPKWEEWIVEEGSMPLLHTLDIFGCTKLKELPDGQHLPSHLKTIHLDSCGLEKDPIPILEKLLHLKEVRLYNSFGGTRMVCSGGGFPQLQKLEIEGLFELEEWIVEEGSMPLLHTLHITDCPKLEEWIVEEGSMPLLNDLDIFRCPKLKELPDGLRFIHSLKKLEMDKEWKERLSEGGAEYYKVQHIPSVEFLGE